MNRHRALVLLASLSLSTLAVGAVGCSNAHSPTEPAFDEPLAAASSASTVSEKRHGADDPAGDNRRGRGNDDRQGDNRRGRGNDDQNNDRRGRGNGGQRPPQAGAEFEGAVAAVNGGTIVLAGGTRVTVNAQTQWNARGDLTSLAQVAASVSADDPTRVEGRGIRQADGSFLAQTIKAEVDD
jgi:uncharacterized protein DUF5666